MKTHSAPFFVSSIAAALMLGAAPAIAADTSSADKMHSNTSQATSQNKQADARSAKDAEKAWEQSHRASKLIGTDVMNAKGAKVGTVKDLVLDDPASGQVTRVVVSVGGVGGLWEQHGYHLPTKTDTFLAETGGLGDKLFAVPFNALQRDQAKNTFVLNTDSDLAHAFNDNNWQALANQGPSTSARASASAPVPSNTAAGAPTTNTSANATPPATSASTSSGSAGSATASGNASNTAIGAPSSSDTSTTK